MKAVVFAMTTFIASYLAISPSAVIAQQIADPLGHRLKLSFFQYLGSKQGSESNVYFLQFKGILRDKLTILVEDLADGSDRFEYLKHLSLDPSGEGGLEDRLTTEAAQRNYWDQSHSLLLFRGTLSSQHGGQYFAQSQIYLGSLHGRFPHPSISLRLPIQVQELPDTNDTHSLIVYFALAEDAIRMHDEPSVIIELLSRAQDKVNDLRKAHALSPSILDLSRVIEQAIRLNREGPHR